MSATNLKSAMALSFLMASGAAQADRWDRDWDHHNRHNDWDRHEYREHHHHHHHQHGGWNRGGGWYQAPREVIIVQPQPRGYVVPRYNYNYQPDIYLAPQQPRVMCDVFGCF